MIKFNFPLPNCRYRSPGAQPLVQAYKNIYNLQTINQPLEKQQRNNPGIYFFKGDFSWEGSVPSPKIVINFPRTFDELHCKPISVQRLSRFFGTNRKIDRYPNTLLLGCHLEKVAQKSACDVIKRREMRAEVGKKTSKKEMDNPLFL